MRSFDPGQSAFICVKGQWVPCTVVREGTSAMTEGHYHISLNKQPGSWELRSADRIRTEDEQAQALLLT